MALRIAVAQINCTVGDLAGNAARILAAADEAHALGADLLLTPELALAGYPPEDLLLRPDFHRACARELSALAQRLPLPAVVGHPEMRGPLRYNAASLLRDGRVEVTYHKQRLPNSEVFDEERYFAAGSAPCVFMLGETAIGLAICEDIWLPGTVEATRAAGAELLLALNASPFHMNKAATRQAVLRERIMGSGMPAVYCNLVGGQDEVVYDGGSLLVNADGTVAARAPAFVDALLWAEFDPVTRTLDARDWPTVADASPEAVLYAGIARGIRDYIGKNGFPGVLLGLSGGIDSALTLALAVDALGADRVTAVMMPSRYTSKLSLEGARGQAERLGVDYHVIGVEPTVGSFIDALTPAFAGKGPDTTEENLQSRTRGVMLMALSNKHGRLLLATGNKSEMAVGYATLYGDMCGAYAPLKDVYKTVVYRLARWRNRAAELASADVAAAWVIPPEVIDRPPSAELRADQTDQDSLPPYDELDAILERFIEGEQSQAEIIGAGFAADIVHRVVRLVLVNEFKRRQSAPGPRVTSRAFGRERRYPITSGWR